MNKGTGRFVAILAAALAVNACGRKTGPENGAVADAGSSAPRPATAEEKGQFIRWFEAQPRVPINISSEGAKVMILKFNDFQCPPCAESQAAFMPIIKKLQAEHPGAIRYVMVDYPLEAECNKYVALGPHPAACEAAAAVRLAWAHNRQAEMMDWLFAHQEGLTPAVVKQAAKDVGQIDDFDAQYAPTLEKIKGDIELGHFLQVEQTPTFYVNGVKVEGRVAADYIEAAIQHELDAAPK
jgi:protein-disulfide isomerase